MRTLNGVLVLLILLLTAASCYGTSPNRKLVVVDDVELYRYKDATDLCVERGLYIAKAAFVEEMLNLAAQTAERHVDICGFVREHRYHAMRPVYTADDDAGTTVSLSACADMWSDGVSMIPLTVYCIEEPNTLKYGRFQYGVVFVPETRVSSRKAARGVCSDLDSVLASSSRMSINEGFQYCECAWTTEKRRVFKFGCTTPEALEECNYEAGKDYPVFCYGVPPLPEFPVGYSPYCRMYGTFYKYLSARTGQRIKQLAERQAACQQADGGILAEPGSEEEYLCMLRWLETEPGPRNWEVAIGFNETDLVTYSLSTGEMSTVLADHWVENRDYVRDRDGPGARCITVDAGRLAGQRGRIIDSSCDHPYGFPSVCQWRAATNAEKK